MFQQDRTAAFILSNSILNDVERQSICGRRIRVATFTPEFQDQMVQFTSRCINSSGGSVDKDHVSWKMRKSQINNKKKSKQGSRADFYLSSTSNLSWFTRQITSLSPCSPSWVAFSFSNLAIGPISKCGTVNFSFSSTSSVGTFCMFALSASFGHLMMKLSWASLRKLLWRAEGSENSLSSVRNPE